MTRSLATQASRCSPPAVAFLAAPLLMLAFACNSGSTSAKDSSPAALDEDGDGYAADVDCDDTSSAIYPGAPERCDNGRDNDCDGLILEPSSVDALTWYIDADQDGIGSSDFVEKACVQPAGWVDVDGDCDDADPLTYPGAAFLEPAPFGGDPYCMRDNDGDGYGDSDPSAGIRSGSDCDDTDPEVHPDATEVCDGIDTNCDGEWRTYEELDGDGDRFVPCERNAEIPWRGEGSIAGGGDCDDAEPSAFPGNPETCADDFDNNCDGFINEADAYDAPLWYRDADQDGFGRSDLSVVECDPGDGWVLTSGDCNDLRADVSPVASEVCDDEDEDEDCSGDADGSDALGKLDWYLDSDGDGWVNYEVMVQACNAPSGYLAYTTADAVDCDDTDAAVSPDQDEVCNDIDDNCDGDIDEDDAIDAVEWYRDADGDGYGDVDLSKDACAEPSGYVDNADDCDDSAGDVNPSEVEICDVGHAVDEDCDGVIDGSSASDAVYWYVDYDEDGYGLDDTSLAVKTCDTQDPSVSSLTYVLERAGGFDCDDAEAERNPGESDAGEACYDDVEDNDCDASSVCEVDTAFAAEFADSSAEMLGGSLVFVEDYDGAGTPAVLASEADNRAWLLAFDGSTLSQVTFFNLLESSSPSAIASGELYANGSSDVVFGRTTSGTVSMIYGPLDTYSASTGTDVEISTTGLTYTAGSSIAVIDDLDGNGTPELLLGGLKDDGSDSGQAWLLDAPFVDQSLADCGAETGTEEDSGAPTQCYELSTSTVGDGFATLVASAGDLDADGRDELLLTAPIGGPGVVYLLGGAISGSTAVDVTATTLTGDVDGDEAGASVAGGADLDGDGYNDLLVGAPQAALTRGVTYLVRGPISSDVALRASDAVLTGISSGSGAGSAVSFAGDLNGDGNEDIAIGAPNDSTVWVVYGPVSGSVDLSTADVTLEGESSDSALGTALLGPGDAGSTGSVTNNLFVGEPGADSEAGQVGVLMGVFP